MKIDPLNELFIMARMFNDSRFELAVRQWATKHVKQVSTRHYCDKIKDKDIERFQRYAEEKMQHELAVHLVEKAAMSSVDETDTGKILIKTIFVLG